MASVRGFVQKIEAGRAGLVSVTLIHADGSTGVYVVRDIDGDPERFNERLTKIGILRDAMNRAEPVFIEHTSSDSGEEIQTAARISRDELDPPGELQQVAGLVVDVAVHTENAVNGDAEKHDLARIELVTTGLDVVVLILDMQVPERQVTVQQLEMIRDAQTRGRLVRFVIHQETLSGNEGKMIGAIGRIYAVAVDNNPNAFGDRRAQQIDGFVESLSLIHTPLKGAAGSFSFAHVRFTTAPPFTGPGNTIGLTPFTPITIDLFVPKGSLSYELFEAGLRDNLRMRVSAVLIQEEGEPGDTGDISHIGDTGSMIPYEASSGSSQPLMKTLMSLSTGMAHTVDEPEMSTVGLAFAAELLAHLASASRPVWITIARESLDHGPDGFACTDGVPSSDLAPQSLRDLRIPYPAVWHGLGCFNPGVYRFQLQLPGSYTVLVDNEELCLHDSEVEGIKFAHACLAGDHEVIIKLDAWVCDDEFIMDIYQIR